LIDMIAVQVGAQVQVGVLVQVTGEAHQAVGIGTMIILQMEI